MRRVRLAILVLVVCGGLAFASNASSSQGDAVNGGSTWNGARVNITGSGTLGSTSALWATVAIQNCDPQSCSPLYPGPAGGYQVGEHDSTSNYTDDCGTGIIGVVAERLPVNGYYACNPYFGTWGSNQRFAEVYVSGSGWQGYENGTKIDGPYSLGYTGGWTIARGEYENTAPSSYSFTWGPSGYTAWQASTNNGSSYTTLLTSTAESNGSGWTIGSAPSPFTISR